MDKIFEKKTTRPPATIRKRLNARLIALAAEYSDYGITHIWNDTKDRVLVKSKSAPVKAIIIVSKNKLVGYMDVPIFIKSLMGNFQERLLQEVDEIVK